MKTVTVKNIEIGAGAPKIIVSLVGNDAASLISAADRYKTLPCDLIEWRADHLMASQAHPETMIEIARALSEILPQPLIFTYRTEREGVPSPVSIDQYAAINQMMIKERVADLVDIEYAVGYALFNELAQEAKAREVEIIASNHEFEKTPTATEIVKRLTAMQNLGASVVKVAAMAKKKKDTLTMMTALLQFTEKNPEAPPVIAISMGDIGRASRLFAGEFGSCATFAAAETSSAPGQLDLYAVKNVMDILNQAGNP